MSKKKTDNNGNGNEFENNSDQKEITNNSKSNFLYSFSLLSKEKNDAINTVYAFCRKTDDIVDNENESAEKKYTRLQEWKNELIKAVENGKSKFSLLNKVDLIIKKFQIPIDLFFELIEGMEMDLRQKRYNSFNELSEYCYKVASTVGLMSVEIFGYKNPATKYFAVNLGIALQLTNIIRDVKADAEIGRIYLPLEDLRKFNYKESELLEGKFNENFINLMKFQCERAKFFYNEATNCLPKEDKGNMFPARIMQHIYFRILKKIEASNYNVFDKKISISKLKKMLIAAGVYAKYKILYSFDESRLALNGK